jgi:hypothetical protein
VRLRFAAVAVLNFPRRPSRVAWFVMAVCVDAVKGQIGRALSHVGKEIRIAMTPLLAYLNASAAIPAVVPFVGVVAAFVHTSPSLVSARECAAGCAAVTSLRIASSAHFTLSAPARVGVAVQQVLSHLRSFGAAVALTQPEGARAVDGHVSANCNELSESSAGNVGRGSEWHSQYFSTADRTAPLDKLASLARKQAA